MNTIGIIALILASVLLSAEASSNKWGVKGRRDVLLYTKDVIKMCEDEGGCTETVKYPVEGDINEKTITFIYASDELGEESTVKSQITEGGFGSKSVTIEISAQQGQAINNVIEIYGKQFVFFGK